MIQGLESTIPEGRLAGRTEELGIESAKVQLELGLRLSLAINKHEYALSSGYSCKDAR